MKQNLFIALEGIDGSGKTTQARLLSQFLEKAGHRVVNTAEPTPGPIGSIIRDIFNHRMEADHRTIAGLFVADRLDHLLNKSDGILRMLDEGFNVICDRYYFSSYAYQGTHMSLDWVISANEMSAELLRPDINIFIDIDPALSMERLDKGRESMELYETLENLKLVRNKYFEAFEKLKSVENIYLCDGNRPAEQIAEDIWQEVARLFVTRDA